MSSMLAGGDARKRLGGALCVVVLVGCAEGRMPGSGRTDGGRLHAIDGGLDATTGFDFPDASWPDADMTDGGTTDAARADAHGLDAASTDAPIPDAHRPMPDAWTMPPPDAFVARPDAPLPDAFGECVEGSRTSCATSCGTTGSALCSGGRLGPCMPPMEVCNGIDDDCRGGPDDTYACVLGRSEICVTSCGSAGMRTCGATCAWGACMPTSAETCNGRDEDCDGSIDEGFRARPEFTSYSVLFTRHPGCDGLRQRWGTECNAAIHRLCTDGCTTSGFGPVENSGDVANVACVIGDVRHVTYSTLASHHAGCDGFGERMGRQCNAAIHRYCVANGFVSGFGPVENDGPNAYVSCVRSAETRSVSYARTLASHHEGCDGVVERIGPNCNAAIHRYCAGQGFTSGFGPVENEGDSALVTCVRP